MELDEFRASLDRWLVDNAAALAPEHPGMGTLDQQMAQLAKVKRSGGTLGPVTAPSA